MKAAADPRSRLRSLASSNNISLSASHPPLSNDPPRPPQPTITLVFGSSSNNALGPVKQGGLKRSIYTEGILAPKPPPMRQRPGVVILDEDEDTTTTNPSRQQQQGKVITGGSVIPSSDSPYKVFCGHSVTTVVTDGGRLYTWGNTSSGSDVLGHNNKGARYNKIVPVCKGGMEYNKVEHSMLVSTGSGGDRGGGGGDGENYGVAVTNDGRIVGWGKGGKGRMGKRGKGGGFIDLKDELGLKNEKSDGGEIREEEEEDYKVIDVGVGGQFTVLCTKSGRLISTGANDAGQLGLNDTNLRRTFTMLNPVGKSVRFRKVSCGLNHTAAVSVGGEVWTMGWGGEYRLGHGDEGKRTRPTRVDGLVGEIGGSGRVFVMDVGCTGASVSVLDDQGDVYGWGWNAYGQVGCANTLQHDELMYETNENLNSFVNPNTNPPKSKSDMEGELESSGANSVRYPSSVLTGKVVTTLSCGYGHVCVVSAIGEMWSWGFNEEGQCGVGHEGNVKMPTKVRFEVDIDGVGKVDSDGVGGGGRLRVLDVGCGHTHSAVVVGLLSGVENEVRRREGKWRREAGTRLLKFARRCLFVVRRRKFAEDWRSRKVVEVKEEVVEEVVVAEEEEEEEDGGKEERLRLLAESAAAAEAEAERLRMLREEELENERLEALRLAKLREEERERVEREGREERERVLMEREELRMRRYEVAKEEERVKRERERVRRMREEEEERRRFGEEEMMRREDLECRRVAEERRRLIQERKLRAEEERERRRVEEEEIRMRREARRIMDVKKAADRLKKARNKKEKEKKKREGGGVKRSGSAGGLGLGLENMKEMRRRREEEKREKAEREGREREKKEMEAREERRKRDKKTMEMVRRREERLRVEEERKREEREEEEEERRKAEEEEEERRLREDEERRVREDEERRRKERIRALAERGRKREEEEEEVWGMGGLEKRKVVPSQFRSANGWGRKLSKSGGKGGMGGVVKQRSGMG